MTATYNYDTCEVALKNVLEGISGMSGLVTQSDYRLFDEGTERFIVLQPDDFDSEGDGWGLIFYNWHILVELYQKYTNESQTMSAFRAFRRLVTDQLEKYPTLNGGAGIISRTVSAEGGVRNVTERGNENIVYYKTQVLRVIVRQQVSDISGGEFF